MNVPQETHKELLIVIPAYNEEKNIGPVLEQLNAPEIRQIANVLVVNDASKDHTSTIAASYGANCVSHIFNMGYGVGLQVGYKYAVRNKYKYVIQMDADGQHDVCNVMNLYRELTNSEDGRAPDIVLGSRYMKGSAEYNCGAVKQVAYAWFRLLIRWMTGERIADPTTGLQGLNWRTLKFYSGYLHFDDRYPDANMLTQMMLLGFKVRQIPAVMHYRTEGVSMHSGVIKPMIYMIRVSLQIIAAWIRIRILKLDIDEAKKLLASTSVNERS